MICEAACCKPPAISRQYTPWVTPDPDVFYREVWFYHFMKAICIKPKKKGK